MIKRTASTLTALAFTIIAVTGIAALVALDLFGEEGLLGAWDAVTRPAPEANVDLSELQQATGFTFFTDAPVEGHGLEVKTGVAFATFADLLARHQQSRWCYLTVLAPGTSIPRQITLGEQDGVEKPVYSDPTEIPAEELASLGLGPEFLASIARSHCRFAGDGADDTAPDTDIPVPVALMGRVG